MKGTRIVWPEKGRAALEEFEAAVPGPEELLVESELTLVSPGTERAHLLGLPNTPNQFPAYPGYSNLGVVRGRGAGVTLFQPGQRVASYSPHWSLVTVSERMAAPVPDGLDPEAAVFCSLANVALQGVRKAGIEIGSSVAVLGLGLIGLFALQWARIGGAVGVIGIDVSSDRLSLAERLGATEVIELRGTQGREFDTVIDATGIGDAIIDALRLTRWRGATVVLGSSRAPAHQVDFYGLVHKKGLRVIGAHDYVRPEVDSSPGYWSWQRDAEATLRFMCQGRLTTTPIPERRFRPDEVEALYAELLAGSLPLAVQIDWRQARG